MLSSCLSLAAKNQIEDYISLSWSGDLSGKPHVMAASTAGCHACELACQEAHVISYLWSFICRII